VPPDDAVIIRVDTLVRVLVAVGVFDRVGPVDLDACGE
jgi:hypothetical protein